MDHLQPVPKTRSSSITSIESADEPGTMKQVLLPPTINLMNWNNLNHLFVMKLGIMILIISMVDYIIIHHLL